MSYYYIQKVFDPIARYFFFDIEDLIARLDVIKRTTTYSSIGLTISKIGFFFICSSLDLLVFLALANSQKLCV